jgi:hypothetical protein
VAGAMVGGANTTAGAVLVGVAPALVGVAAVT